MPGNATSFPPSRRPFDYPILKEELEWSLMKWALTICDIRENADMKRMLSYEMGRKTEDVMKLYYGGLRKAAHVL